MAEILEVVVGTVEECYSDFRHDCFQASMVFNPVTGFLGIMEVGAKDANHILAIQGADSD